MCGDTWTRMNRSMGDRNRATFRKKNRLAFLMKRVTRSRTYPVIAAVLLVFLMSSLGVLFFEYGANQGFVNMWDAVWWTLVTAATVGYGDKVPLTTGGRLVAILVMLLGIGLLGMITGRIASWLVAWKIKEGSGLADQKKIKKHFVICGWKSEMVSVLEDILCINPHLSDEDIVVVSTVEQSKMENLRSNPNLQNVRFVRGDYVDENVLLRANIKKADRVLVLADKSNQASDQEVDARTVMTVLTIKTISRDIYTCVELIDSKFKRYLENVHCDEIVLSREHNRILLANATAASGIAHIVQDLLNVGGGWLITKNFPDRFVGDSFANLSSYFMEGESGILIGLLENTGNIFQRKREALHEAQKTPDISRLIANLQEVKELRGNLPVFNPGPDYRIKSYSRAILIQG
jgi:voltage-gated potassium channel